jgi:hypothetical protein
MYREYVVLDLGHTDNPTKSLPPDQNVCQNLSRCQIRSSNHQPPVNHVVHTMLTTLCTGCFYFIPSSPATSHGHMHANCERLLKYRHLDGHLPKKRAWFRQDNISVCHIDTVCTDDVHMLSCGRHGTLLTGQARAPESPFVYMQKFAWFQIHTLRPSRPTLMLLNSNCYSGNTRLVDKMMKFKEKLRHVMIYIPPPQLSTKAHFIRKHMKSTFQG